MNLIRPSSSNHNLKVRAVGVLLFLLSFIPRISSYAQTNPVLFRDDFNRSELGDNWSIANGWSIRSGYAYNSIDGSGGTLSTAEKFSAPSFILETTSKGYTVNYQREFRIVFGQNSQDVDSAFAYVVSYTPYAGGQLTLSRAEGNFYYTQSLDEVSIYPDLETSRWYKFKIARYKSGLIQVYLDRGRGYPSIPTLEAIDTTYPQLGHFGWQIDTQTAAEDFFVDWIEARQPDVEKPAEREKPAQDDLVTQVSAASNRSYSVAKLNPGEKSYSDQLFSITSIPEYLKGASFIQSSSADKQDTSRTFLTMFLKKPVVLYVAYDPKATRLPAWLSDWTKTGDIIETDDPANSYLNVYSKLVEFPYIYPDPFLLGGNLTPPAAGAQSNYLVIAVEKPAIAKYEAEFATIKGGQVDINHLGYSGTGFVNYINPNDDYVEWTVKIQTPGLYNVGLNYSNGREANRALHFSVDGVGFATHAFTTTYSWDTWSFYGGNNIFLSQGTHTIRASAIGQSGPNVDYLSLSYVSAAKEISRGRSAIAGLSNNNTENSNMAIKKHYAYPNPFANSTTITYTLSEDVPVHLAVYSLQGQQLKVLVNEKQKAGTHEVHFDGASLAKGVYLYRLQTGKQNTFSKIVKQ
ncbi:T9SS type A sorting domain-containing protein [Adhaeribacter radiodurans]|uniref:T9SS type A sorting domain-containing protein n=1 Tax=Adhaeribacter radiodurans TaxID=2745197 RepID=A0A7L7L7M6_9BACT|nr:T9SS type A sorting domain-containing protein [Adhaeribacter radiodurans]QMU28826.1 T9SS type A sorting domain-containing protein [Adhaeribacter radiodurans]